SNVAWVWISDARAHGLLLTSPPCSYQLEHSLLVMALMRLIHCPMKISVTLVRDTG
ncbi:hypothetical protein GW17_00053143, partial [Ensete ventricosum]